MKNNLENASKTTFDLAVIGGGITGAGIARDAAMRGLKVALFEKGDFASGTSSKSSKMIHGGLRYLQMMEFSLVKECREERLILFKIAPHLVKPLKFLLPIYKGDKPGKSLLKIGLWLYDKYASSEKTGKRQSYSRSEFAKIEPNLLQENLLAGAEYWDSFVDDARLVLENILSAEESGAQVFNYAKVEKLVRENPHKLTIVDTRSGEKFEISAKTIVNATGPWLDETSEIMLQKPTNRLRPTKGITVILPKIQTGEHAILFKHPDDERVMFSVPWCDFTIVGTTDTDFTDSPDNCRETQNDVDYVMRSVSHNFPKCGLKNADIVSVFSGVRPLVLADDGDESATSRDFEIYDEQDGIYSIGGGKLTSYRAMAETMVNKICKKFQRHERCKTAIVSFPGGAEINFEKYQNLMSSEMFQSIVNRYGSRAELIFRKIIENSEKSKPIFEDFAICVAELEFSIEFEHTKTAEDFLFRRTRIGLFSPKKVDIIAKKITEILSK